MKRRISILPNYILLLVLQATVLALARIPLFGSSTLIYLLWNIFLALLPLMISTRMLRYASSGKLTQGLFVVSGILWLLLLPNAPYLVTDLIHVGRGSTLAVFYNTALLFSCALVGFVIMVETLTQMQEIFTLRFTKNTVQGLMIATMFLASFGVSLGRFMRFNSWDIVTHPTTLLINIWSIVSVPYLHVDIYLLTCVFFFLIFMSYSAWGYKTTVM